MFFGIMKDLWMYETLLARGARVAVRLRSAVWAFVGRRRVRSAFKLGCWKL